MTFGNKEIWQGRNILQSIRAISISSALWNLEDKYFSNYCDVKKCTTKKGCTELFAPFTVKYTTNKDEIHRDSYLSHHKYFLHLN